MKKIILIAMLTFGMQAMAQQKKFPVKGERVTVKDWGSRSVMILPGFFDDTRDSIVYMIGEDEFNAMKDKCDQSGWPEGLYRSDLDEEADRAFDKKLGELVMYRIATYTHYFHGNKFDQYVILRVPYGENRNWDAGVKWEGNIYFLLKAKDIVGFD